MKTNALIRIILFSITILVLLGILFAGLALNSYGTHLVGFTSISGSGNGSTHVPLGETVRIAPDKVENISIEWVAGSITVQPGDVEDITISESGSQEQKYTMIWKQSGNRLKIQFCEESFSFIGFSIQDALSKDLVITVPRNWSCTNLDIDAASAQVYVNDMSIWEVELDSASGTCDFQNCNVDAIDLDTASGDICFTGSLNELDCDAASASFTGTLTNIPSRMDMDTMSGDLDITLPADCGFTVSMDGISSGFCSDFDTTTKNGHHVHGDGACHIDISAMSGDVTIRKGECHTDGTPCHGNDHHH